MKKLTGFILGMMIALTAISQTSAIPPNHTLIPTNSLKDAAFVIEGLKLKVDLLNDKIKGLQAQISLLNANEADYQANERKLQEAVNLLEWERDNLKLIVEARTQEAQALQKQLKKQKRKTIFVGIAGIVVSFVTFTMGAR